MNKTLFWLWRVLRFLFLPLSFFYGILIVLRNLFYNLGIFRTRKLPRPVISVGNIVAGGTGKTPMVEWISRYFSSLGKKVAILSRGYGRRTKGFVLVSDGEKIFAKPDECGDEPFQMALKSIEENLGWIVAVCEDRYLAGVNVIEKFAVDVFILDDGFQRRDVYRDLDIVIISGEEIKEFLIPAGLKREPLNSLKRADVICFRKNVDVQAFKPYLKENSLLVKFDYELLEIRKFFDYILNKSELSGKKVVAFSGIGKHTNFIKLLKDNNFQIVKDFEFPDHHCYSHRDIKKIIDSIGSTGADFAITTEKDFARLFEVKELRDFPFFYAKIEVRFLDDGENLKQKLLEQV